MLIHSRQELRDFLSLYHSRIRASGTRAAVPKILEIDSLGPTLLTVCQRLTLNQVSSQEGVGKSARPDQAAEYYLHPLASRLSFFPWMDCSFILTIHLIDFKIT